MPPSAGTLRARARAGSPADCSLSLVPQESSLLVNCWLIGVGEGGAFLFPFVIVILIPPPSRWKARTAQLRVPYPSNINLLAEGHAQQMTNQKCY